MNKWINESWEFELTVTSGKAGHCRLGLETGDKFVFQYACPADMCPKTMVQVYKWCFGEGISGDFARSEIKETHEMDISCPDGCIQFHLKAYPINCDENGKHIGNKERPQD